MRIRRISKHRILAAAICCCAAVACSSDPGVDLGPSDLSGQDDSETVAPGDVPGDVPEDIRDTDMVDVADILVDALDGGDATGADARDAIIPDTDDAVDTDTDDAVGTDTDDAVDPDANDAINPDIDDVADALDKDTDDVDVGAADTACIPDCGLLECGPDPICGTDCGACTGSDVCVDGLCVWQAADYVVSCGADGMCEVPAGPFWMGCNETVSSQCYDHERPYHQVTLPGFMIDRTEVTHSQYKLCVDAGQCLPLATDWNPSANPNRALECYWPDAEAYCAWAGKRLPTEAEWEKAARGIDGRAYPWGNTAPTCDFAVMSEGYRGCGTGSQMDVCSKSPAGDSPYGLCDMSGNVNEWVSDWYYSRYYREGAAVNPAGPTDGIDRIMRGGNFWSSFSPDSPSTLRASHRSYVPPDYPSGFRCARSYAQAEMCDGVDNDNDGLTDEDFTAVDWDGAVRAIGESCGTGACAGGHVTCSLKGSYAECDTSHLASIERFDEFDNDCNGLIDDDYCTFECCARECGMDPIFGVDCGACTGSDVCVYGQCVWQAGEYTVDCGEDGMCRVPAGPFWMGCNDSLEMDCYPGEAPYHEVNLSAYSIDRTEVTQGEYEKCVDVGACLPQGYSGPEGKPDLPVVWVNWQEAAAYCAWVGKRLPTEAEWEKAARGTDGRVFPWGNDRPTCEKAMMRNQYGEGCGTGDIADVCTKSPQGDSPYGLCDMSGNVFEWVSDWWNDGYYATSPETNPTGPASGTYRGMRGGSTFWFDWDMFRTSVRGADKPNYSYREKGFRCARSE